MCKLVTTQPLPCGSARRASSWEGEFPGTNDQVGLVRREVRAFAAGFPKLDDLVLIMSELAANAVRHTDSGVDGGTFRVRLLDVPGRYVLGEVEDDGSPWEGDLRASRRDASGLSVVLGLASSCGVAGDGWKRVVWVRLVYEQEGGPGACMGATIRAG